MALMVLLDVGAVPEDDFKQREAKGEHVHALVVCHAHQDLCKQQRETHAITTINSKTMVRESSARHLLPEGSTASSRPSSSSWRHPLRFASHRRTGSLQSPPLCSACPPRRGRCRASGRDGSRDRSEGVQLICFLFAIVLLSFQNALFCFLLRKQNYCNGFAFFYFSFLEI